MIFVNSSGGRIGRIFWTNSSTDLVNLAVAELDDEIVLTAPHSRWGCVTWNCLRFYYEEYEGPIFPSIVSTLLQRLSQKHDHHSR